MLDVILVLLSGVIVGRLLKGRNLKFVPKVIMVTIYLLLLLLGMSVGSNPQVINSLGTIGVQALILTLLAVLGSAVAALFIYRTLFKNRGL